MLYPTKDLAMQRCTYWIERLESQVEELLCNASIDNLPPIERFNLAAKYLALLQRFLLLAQKNDLTIPSNDSQRLLDSLRAHLRGEWPMEIEENGKGTFL